jgi:arginase
MKAVHIIGVPLDLGGNRRGTDMGPSAFRIAGIGDQLARLGMHVTDKGDVEAPIPEKKGSGDPHKKYVKEIAKVCQKVYQSSLESFAAGAMPIVLGGDHSLGAGSVAAAAAHLRSSGKPSV